MGIKSILKKVVLSVYHILFQVLPIGKRTIIFESSVGRNYTGNPKAIYEQMVAQGLDKTYECIWVLEDVSKVIPGKCKKVKRQRLKYFYYMSYAKFWVVDSRQPIYLKKKPGHVYIQTWHGTPLKKLGLDMSFVNMSGHTDIEAYIEGFKADSKRWDYLISQNRYSTKHFKSAFDFHKQMLEIGYPRNDVLFKDNKEQMKALKAKLNLSEDKKVILYAPTWRDNVYTSDGKYKLEMPIDLDRFKKLFGETYTLIIKPHYLIADQINIEGYESCVRVCGIEYDIQDLYLIADAMITDYSSVMFDYSILQRPMIFFMYDLAEYQNSIREFYFDILEEAPGRIVTTNDELMDAILAIETDKVVYQEKYEAFRAKYNELDKGIASKRIIELIKSYE